VTSMADVESSAHDEPDRRRGQDRETESIPRARAEADDDTVESERYVGSAAVDPSEDSPTFEPDEFIGVRGGPEATPLPASRRVLPLEEEPSKLIARYLFPTEKFRGEWKRHWVQIAKELLGVAGATILMGYLTGLAAKSDKSSPSLVTGVIVIWAAVMIFMAWRIADWYVDRFILTNKRVMVVKGLITRNVGMMPLLRVTDMKYVQSPIGRLLGYGTFELESAGQDQALSKIRNLPNPNELYLRIVEEMYEPEAVEARLSRGAAEDSDGT
jgi:membrane protein YdbS with pleckstrin-like domain